MGGKPGSGEGTTFVEEQQQHSVGLSLLPGAAYGVVLLGQLPLPQVLPRNKVSIPLALPEEPLPSADPLEPAKPLLSLLSLQRPSHIRSGASSQMQPTPSIYNKGTDEKTINSNTVCLQKQDYIQCAT